MAKSRAKRLPNKLRNPQSLTAQPPRTVEAGLRFPTWQNMDDLCEMVYNRTCDYLDVVTIKKTISSHHHFLRECHKIPRNTLPPLISPSATPLHQFSGNPSSISASSCGAGGLPIWFYTSSYRLFQSFHVSCISFRVRSVLYRHNGKSSPVLLPLTVCC